MARVLFEQPERPAGAFPRETFADVCVKLLSLAAVAALTSVVLWALLKIGHRA